nr:hypothetical protein [Candidatus Dadabacteria bacterium]
NINTDEDEINDATIEEFLSDLSDSIVKIVNAKEGLYGTVNFYLNGEQESSANFD